MVLFSLGLDVNHFLLHNFPPTTSKSTHDSPLLDTLIQKIISMIHAYRTTIIQNSQIAILRSLSSKEKENPNKYQQQLN